MKSLKSLPILVIVLLLQGCLPDSFTKFKEEPATTAEGASGGGSGGGSAACPPGSQLTDPFCLEPTRVQYTDDFEFLIGAEEEDEGSNPGQGSEQEGEQAVQISPTVLGASNVEGFTEFMTFTITPALPSSTGLSFDVETGIISGEPKSFYKDEHTIEAVYTGNTPVTLDQNNEIAEIEIIIATSIGETLAIENSPNKTLVLKVDDVAPFIGKTHASGEGSKNGGAEILFVDTISNEVHLDSNNISADGNFILRTSNELGIDARENFALTRAQSSGITVGISVNPDDILNNNTNELTVDQGSLSTSITINPLGELFSITQDERETYIYAISPSIDPSTGLIFTEETTCYDLAGPTEVSDALCDAGAANHQEVLGGTLWGTVPASTHLLPTEYTISASNLLGQTATRTFQLSISDPVAPKSFDELAYYQKVNQKLRIPVTDTAPFSVNGPLVNQFGKTATIDGIDESANELFVSVTSGGKDLFLDGQGLDNSPSYFSEEASVSGAVTYLYDDRSIDDSVQPFLEVLVEPTDIFEDPTSPNREEMRSLDFAISPNIEELGLNFQEKSGCFDSLGNENLTGGEPDFTPCDSGTPGFQEIRGGTVWGDFGNTNIPLNDSEFTVTVTSQKGQEKEVKFNFEVSPFQEDAEFSYSQDVLVRIQEQDSNNFQDVETFQEGDFISTQAGTFGYAKEVFNADGFTFIWAKVTEGFFKKNDDIDNMKIYKNQRGFVLDAQPIYAKLTTSGAVAGIDDIMIDQEVDDNVLTTASGARARLVYQNGNDLYVRVTEGSLTTGDTLLDEAGASLGVSIDNINAQNLEIEVSSLAALTPQPAIDHSLVYSDDPNGEDYIGVVEVRSINGTTLEVELIKGEIGTVERLYLRNPYNSGDNDSVAITSIATNSNRYTFYKDLPVSVVPHLEPGFEVGSYTIEPPLPEGISLDADTGIISGRALDRSEFVDYTLTITNNFDNPSYQPKEFTFALEVKDYFGIFDSTQNVSSYIMHKAGMGNGRSNCMVTRNQFNSSLELNRDITCFLETGESELHFQGMNLEVRFGSDMCQFIQQEPFATARFLAGATDSVTPPNDEVHEGDIFDAACQASGADPARNIDPQDLCEFDYSDQDGLGNYNCDEGIFDYNLRTFTAFEGCNCGAVGGCDADTNDDDFDEQTCGNCDDGTIQEKDECEETSSWNAGAPIDSCQVESEATEHQCNGEVSACMEGAGTDILTKKQIFERFIVSSNVQNVDKLDFQTTSPFDKGFRSNRYTANFMNANQCYGTTSFEYDYGELEDSFTTKSITAINNREIVSPFTGRPYYAFNCNDGAGDTIARIRLVVRDWNRNFRASDNIDRVDPDSLIGAPADQLMDRSGIILGENLDRQLNSFVDFEATDFGGASNFSGGSCNVLDMTDFPDDLTVEDRCTDCPY